MKYGKAITEEIAKLLSEGSNRTDACVLAGISYETFTQWIKKPEFSEAIKKAEAICKQRNIKIIQRAAITTWQAAAWWLERRHFGEFALKQQHELSGSLRLEDLVSGSMQDDEKERQGSTKRK